MKALTTCLWVIACASLPLSRGTSSFARPLFDHDYVEYAALLRTYVGPPRFDYAMLKAHRTQLDRIITSLTTPTTETARAWTPAERMAFWINAYNALTLRAIVDHYPLRASWFSWGPGNSIRSIDGVWTRLTWQVAGRQLTLDDIEHRILRPQFHDARVHFAVNCASISCPPLADRPYRAATLGAQLDAAARAYLGGDEGVRIAGSTLRVSSLFKWYGDDFVDAYAAVVPGRRSAKERAILGTLVTFGPQPVAALARMDSARIEYLDYDWSLNEARR